MAASQRNHHSSTNLKAAAAAAAAFESVACYVALALVALALLNALTAVADTETLIKGRKLIGRRWPCDEIYVVGEGETLHTISEKCGDPYIVEQNPHIHDPDDVYPGLVLKITSPFP